MLSRGVNDIKLWLRQGAKIVDVRTQAEYAGFHLPGAVNVPYDEIDQNLEKLQDWDALIITYSTYGLRSNAAAIKLQKHGIPAIATTRERLCELLAI